MTIRLALHRTVAALLCCAMAVPATASTTGDGERGAGARDERVIRCESRNYRYNYCRADTDNRAALVSQVSALARCELGRTWGYDNRGVWVDRGCAGEFRVGRPSGSGSGAAAAGVIAGAAIIAAIAAAQHDKRRDSVPSWAVGSFRGFDDREQADLEIRITPSGTAQGIANGQRFSGTWANDRLELAQFHFRVTRAGNGFNAVDERDDRHRIYFTPSGWGQ